MQAAIDAVPAGRGPVTIRIEPGTYWGQVYVPASKPGITLAGATGNPRDVVLVDDIAHGTIAPNGNQYGTDCSATLSVAGDGFAAYGLTVQNSFDPAANPQITSPQAVAVKTVADRVVFARDRLLGIQDTVFASSYADPFTPAECFAPGGPPATAPPGSTAPPPSRQLYLDDYITGEVDFLCGSGTAVFDHDTIDILGHPGGTVSAPDTSLAQPRGYLITGSRIINSAGQPGGGQLLPGPALAAHRGDQPGRPDHHPGHLADRGDQPGAVAELVEPAVPVAGRPVLRVPQHRARCGRGPGRPPAHRGPGRAVHGGQLPGRMAAQVVSSGVSIILITGAAGRIGTMLRTRLAAPGRILRLLDIIPSADPSGSGEGVTVTASVTDLAAMTAASTGADAVIHLGGMPGEAPWERILDVNIHGTYTVFEAARRAGVPRVVFASSNHAVGFTPRSAFPVAGLRVPGPGHLLRGVQGDR